ncbi:hypothetical protein [uncultured Brachyspira sp.]|uniref:DUF6115 domain-containing protein n=1 Tax=uncultured Brachyspira sp. TaxID=221953 RepID=UPI0026146F25|nr:hypothetical protein [uncultured Brachyspira sp.]
MQIFISIIINVIILAVTLPLFYIYIVSKARERLEKETVSKAREEIEALVKEFNNIALSRISILEDAITRANKLTKDLNVQDTVAINNNIKKDSEEVKEVKKEEIKKEEVIIENKAETLQPTEQIIEKNENVVIDANNIQKKKLDIRVDDENVKTTVKPTTAEKKESKTANASASNKETTNTAEVKKDEKKVTKKNNIDTAIKAIDDKAKQEALERLRSKLDKTIKTKMSIYDKDEKKSSKTIDDSDTDSDKNANIIKLYKEGLTKEEIAKKLKCSITEIDIVIDLEIE